MVIVVSRLSLTGKDGEKGAVHDGRWSPVGKPSFPGSHAAQARAALPQARESCFVVSSLRRLWSRCRWKFRLPETFWLSEAKWLRGREQQAVAVEGLRRPRGAILRARGRLSPLAFFWGSLGAQREDELRLGHCVREGASVDVPAGARLRARPGHPGLREGRVTDAPRSVRRLKPAGRGAGAGQQPAGSRGSRGPCRPRRMREWAAAEAEPDGQLNPAFGRDRSVGAFTNVRTLSVG